MLTDSRQPHWIIQLALEAAGRSGEASDVDRGLSITELWGEAQQLAEITASELVARVAQHFSLKTAAFERAEPQAIRFVPERLARSCLVFPLRVSDREIVVASCDPMNLSTEEQLRFAAGRTPVFEVAAPADLERTIEAHYRPESAAETLLSDIGAEVDNVHLVEQADLRPLEADETGGEPVVRLSNLILREAVKHRASDVHLAPGRSVGTVHLRVDGVLQLRMRIPMPVLHRVVSRIKILGDLDIADRLRPQDGRVRIRIEDEYYDLRISTVPTREAEKAVIRVLYSDTAPGIENLRMPDQDLKRLRSMLAHRDSIVLVSGPTGSGKTTTLYAALQELNTGDVNIMTVEDPVEFELPGTTQIQVETKRGVTFASALRAILRQDPDIILLGEIRDAETAEIAVQAAQTGHLVLATLHTNEALGVVARLQDLGLPPASISDSVCGMVAQRLLRRLCPDCGEPVADDLTEAEQRLVERYGVMPKMRAVGCSVCDDIGYRGRRPVIETALPSAPLRQLILEGAGIDALRTQAVKDGMQPLQAAALDFVREGVTTLEEVDRALGETGRTVSLGGSAAAAPAEPEPAPVAFETREFAMPMFPDGGQAGAPPPTEEPTSEPSRALVSPSAASDGEPAADGPHDTVRILVADDDPIIRQIASTLLSKAGYSVTEVEDGVAALERLNSDDPDDHVDLIISDLDMPRLNGYDLLRLARGAPRTAALPIVVLTGEEEPETEAKLIEEGADDYIRKPIDPVRFIARVKAVLRRAGG
jgi:type II secretory ATPase GspE/PulE/Tfp pilus assembly ATPase PilB-like protein/CheY-like chemotaxis protein